MTSALLKTDDLLSHTQYFDFEETQDQRFEYVCGEIFAMAGGSEQHALISMNAGVALSNALRDKPCRVYGSDMKLHVQSADCFFYPDVMVLCENSQRHHRYVESPSIIIEVLSPTTEKYDRGQKFQYYRDIESLRAYILLAQDKMMAEVYQRYDAQQWLLRTYHDKAAVISLLNDELSLPLAELYRQVEFNFDSA